MQSPVFITAADLPLVEFTPLVRAITSLLGSIIVPQFNSIITSGDTNFYLDSVVDAAPNTLLFRGRIAALSESIRPDEIIEAGPFINSYHAILPSATSNILQAMSPTVKEEYLIAAGLSPQQFLITLINFTSSLSVEAYIDTPSRMFPGYHGNITGSILFDILITIEDISDLAPGEISATKARFSYLCRHNNSLPELRNWAAELAIPNYNRLTHDELCQAIAIHYGF